MGAKFSKSSKGGAPPPEKAFLSEPVSDLGTTTFDKTSTLPASFRRRTTDNQEVVVTKTDSLPRNTGTKLDRSASFSKRFRKSCKNWARDKGLIDVKKSPKKEKEEHEEEVPTKPSSVVLVGEEAIEISEDNVQETPVEHPKEMDLSLVVAELVVEAHKKKVASRAQSKEVLNDATCEKVKETPVTSYSSEVAMEVLENQTSDKTSVPVIEESISNIVVEDSQAVPVISLNKDDAADTAIDKVDKISVAIVTVAAYEESANAQAVKMAAEEAAAARIGAEEAAAEVAIIAATEAAVVEATRIAAEEAAIVEEARIAAATEAARIATEEAEAVETTRIAAEEAAAAEAARISAEAARIISEEAAAADVARIAAEKASAAEASRIAAEEAALAEEARVVAEEAAAAETARLAAEAVRIAAEEAAAVEEARVAAEEAAAAELARIAAEAARISAEEAAAVEEERVAAEEAAAAETARFAAEVAATAETARIAAEEAATAEAAMIAAEEAASVEAEKFTADEAATTGAAQIIAQEAAITKTVNTAAVDTDLIAAEEETVLETTRDSDEAVVVSEITGVSIVLSKATDEETEADIEHNQNTETETIVPVEINIIEAACDEPNILVDEEDILTENISEPIEALGASDDIIETDMETHEKEIVIITSQEGENIEEIVQEITEDIITESMQETTEHIVEQNISDVEINIELCSDDTGAITEHSSEPEKNTCDEIISESVNLDDDNTAWEDETVKDIVIDLVETVTSESGTGSLDPTCDSPTDDVRSEGGSEGGITTDEGIVASDDEEKDALSGDFSKVETDSKVKELESLQVIENVNKLS